MIKTAKEYHDSTSYKRNSLKGHQLDWQNQPLLYKKYEGLENIPLPVPQVTADVPLKTIQRSTNPLSYSKPFDIKKISTILHLTYSITAEAKYSRGFYYYRNAASAGALYPVEVYLMIRDIDGLEDGLYHFNIMNHSLTRLRKGDFSVYAGSIAYPKPKNRPLISFFLSSIFFRSSWKYRNRAYRYNLLDTGHVLENLILALNSLSIFFELDYDFDDDRLNELIGVDEFREAGLVMLNIPGNESMPDDPVLSIDILPQGITNKGIMSNNDIDYPPIREIHEAGKMMPGRRLSEPLYSPSLFQADEWESIKTEKSHTEIPYPECLVMRRSKRNFIDEKIEYGDFISILDIISDGPGTDIDGKNRSDLLQTAFFAERVKDIVPGLYSLDNSERKFGILHPGIFGEKIAHTCLNQEWLKNAGLHFLFMCDTDELDKKYGPRGYRYAMMEAGRIGQLLYITATSLSLGCCGIGAFYDNEADTLIDLNGGKELRLLYLVAIGKIKSY
jgi:SagB-type dehydrogenase family enzyme